MKRGIFIIITAFFSLCSLASAEFASSIQGEELYTRRFAFLVGANNGGRERVILRFAVDDAQAVREVLEEMGGVLPGDSRFLVEPSRKSFLQEIRGLAADVKAAKGKSRRVEVIMYYSGHSDEESIFLGDDRISYQEFRDIITSMHADVRVAIFDSCASGNLTLPKGVIKRSPFLLDTAYDMKGYAFMTSSSASEAAQESGRLKRSYFTHNLISGMRGAADMNQDGRITLNEAYQYTFDGTRIQTEKTMAGPQHPSYHIQMSGTGDVVITEIWKSTAVLVIDKNIRGKVYIHNQDRVLVVELSKLAGKEISLGLSAGTYRITNIDEGKIFESKVTLENGRNFELSRSRLAQADKIPTQLRGDQIQPAPYISPPPERGKWRIELFGGFATMEPGDLNLRADHEEVFRHYYYDTYYQYLQSNGSIIGFSRNNIGGGPPRIENTIPYGLRFRYSLKSWLDISLGVSHFSSTRHSSYRDDYEVFEKAEVVYIDSTEMIDYKLAASGFVPTIGIHAGTNITRLLRLEAFFTGGPVFAKCMYSLLYGSAVVPVVTPEEIDISSAGMLEERGSGTGLALQTGLRLDFNFFRPMGVFVEAGYAYQEVNNLSGPGKRSISSERKSWDGDWAIKQNLKLYPWGTINFTWPSNAWEGFDGDWWRAGDFKLDLSGFQARIGISYRF